MIFKMAAMETILDFRSELFLAIFNLQSPRCFLPTFKSIGLLDQEKKEQIDFQDGSHCGLLDFRLEQF